MAIFVVLLLKLLPLYVFIALGYLAGVFLHVQRDSVAFLLLYILSPIVVFEGARTVSLQGETLVLPLFFFLFCSILCLLFYALSSFVWRDGTRNLAAFASADGNTGYFGIPVALALFSPSILGVVVLGSIGFVLYESTLGFFVLARGNCSLRETLRKVLGLPLLYAFAVGILCNVLHIGLPETITTVMLDVRGAYAILGMLVIGLGLAGLGRSSVDLRLVGFTSVAKFVMWPLLMIGVLSFDGHVLHFFSTDSRHVMLLLSIVPLAVNTVALSSVARSHPEKAALAVLCSTLLSLVVIPFYALWFF